MSFSRGDGDGQQEDEDGGCGGDGQACAEGVVVGGDDSGEPGEGCSAEGGTGEEWA